MPRKKNTFIYELLSAFAEASDVIPLPLEQPYQYKKRLQSMDPRGYRKFLSYAKRQKYIEISKNSKGQQFIRLTKKGELEMLISKAVMDKPGKWDGKWRLIIFDIPEEAKKKRDLLRWLLKKNDFYKLQGSVFISPYALNREAVKYLNETGLKEYIRILRVDDVDDDKDLRLHFNL